MKHQEPAVEKQKAAAVQKAAAPRKEKRKAEKKREKLRIPVEAQQAASVEKAGWLKVFRAQKRNKSARKGAGISEFWWCASGSAWWSDHADILCVGNQCGKINQKLQRPGEAGRHCKVGLWATSCRCQLSTCMMMLPSSRPAPRHL